jgi:hypothetical protein
MYLRGRKWRKAGEDCIMRSFVNSYISPNVIRAIKSRRIKWVEHVARMGRLKAATYRILVRKPEGRRNLGVLVVD